MDRRLMIWTRDCSIYVFFGSVLVMVLVLLLVWNWGFQPLVVQHGAGAGAGASTEGASTEGASTEGAGAGASTEGASTEGASTEGAGTVGGFLNTSLTTQQVNNILSIQHQQDCANVIDILIATNIPINSIQQYLTNSNSVEGGVDVDALMGRIHCCVKNRLLQQLGQLDVSFKPTAQQYQKSCMAPANTSTLLNKKYSIKRGNLNLNHTGTNNARPQFNGSDINSDIAWDVEYLFDDVYFIGNGGLYLEYEASANNDTKYPIMTQKQGVFNVNDIANELYSFLWRITPLDKPHQYTIHHYLENTCLSKGSDSILGSISSSLNDNDIIMKLHNQAGASTCGCSSVDDMSDYIVTIMPIDPHPT